MGEWKVVVVLFINLWCFFVDDDFGSVDNGYCGMLSLENKRKKCKSKCVLFYI